MNAIIGERLPFKMSTLSLNPRHLRAHYDTSSSLWIQFCLQTAHYPHRSSQTLLTTSHQFTWDTQMDKCLRTWNGSQARQDENSPLVRHYLTTNHVVELEKSFVFWIGVSRHIRKFISQSRLKSSTQIVEKSKERAVHVYFPTPQTLPFDIISYIPR